VLEHRYSGITAERAAEAAIIVREAGESQLIELMNECLRAYPALKVFSLPRVTPERYIELGVRGNAVQVKDAIAMLQTGVTRLGFPWTPVVA
jgi:molybdopterin-biosynthesis enzyme MoeA-like protein